MSNTPSLLAGISGSIYLAAAATKIHSSQRLRVYLRELRLPGAYHRHAANVVIAVEASLAVALLARQFQTITSAAACLASLVLLLIQVYAARTRLKVPCGCFGLPNDRPGLLSIARVAFLTGTSTALAALTFMGAAGASGLARSWQHLLLGLLTGVATLAAFALMQEVAFFEEHRLKLIHNQGR